MGILLHPFFRIGNPYLLQKIDPLSVCLALTDLFMQHQRLPELVTDREDRVQGSHRFLEDHRHVLSPDLPELLW